jgi:hypothetical protein
MPTWPSRLRACPAHDERLLAALTVRIAFTFHMISSAVTADAKRCGEHNEEDCAVSSSAGPMLSAAFTDAQ